MNIDFKAEVLKRKDDLIKDLSNLIKIKSELTTFEPNSDAPFGEGNKEALDFFLNLGKKDGFSVINADNYAGHVEYGKQNEYVAMIGHLDVVPAGSGWSYPPYGAQIVDGKMYGRGTEDDKGPTMAAYYALKILKELNVPLSKRIKLIVGSDEESGWRCVKHYFKKYPEIPVSGFIPDADFPLIYAEKGIVRVNIEGKFNNSELISFNGGLRDNMVPDEAKAILKSNLNIKDLFNQYLKANDLKGLVELKDDLYHLSIEGISAHGSTPELGVNAIDLLNNFLVSIKVNNEITETIEKYLANETDGDKLGLKYLDQEMGPLTVNLGVLETNNDSFKLVLNIRYPNGVIFDNLFETLKSLFKQFEVTYNHHQKLLYNDPNSSLVQTLMSVYQKHTNDYENKAKTIGGGTFARAIPNVVAFGPHFPGKPSFIHQKDEYIEIEDLLKATIIYTEALYELAK